MSTSKKILLILVVLVVSLLTLARWQGKPAVEILEDMGGTVMVHLGSEPGIFDFVVTNVYWDGIEATRRNHPEIPLRQKENGKFAVILNHRVQPGTIESIQVKGPAGYRLDFDVDRPFDRKRLSGYIDDPSVTWFAIYDTRGYLPEGRYHIAVRWKNGKTVHLDKTLKANPELLKAYLQTPKEFYPKGEISQQEASDLMLKWPFLNDGKSYYCSRLQLAGKDFSVGNLHFDNIFVRGGRAGLNIREMRVHVRLEKGREYVWFAEILDSNRLRKVNMVIFTEFQYFQVGA